MRFMLCFAVLVAVCLVMPVLAGAQDYTAGTPVLASPGSSPLPDPCPYQAETAGQVNYKDTEVEPQVAVNPTDPTT